MIGDLLDTSVVSELKRASPNRRVITFVSGQSLTRSYLSVVKIAEIRFGMELLSDAVRRSELTMWLNADRESAASDVGGAHSAGERRRSIQVADRD